ncbi:predicted protein [Thalassiosira pseudonana CCMP1335]|uniref:Uncharacterized protein n=1 Tax=Thalassiosira pseudonana TaxID=35128 RepID=B8BQT6_THAPS|nr:predicted protein [Thalassiosira pseudonana CCMP1335]EED96420.1 predicted protein [Thalassiosira pseudonana CCMP1335]|eukprot:scaffold2720_cov181-Alexandrium_tamarense.AAC.13
MKTSLIATLTLLSHSATAFAPQARNTFTRAMSANAVPLANGAMSFDRVCREWRCKYEGDKATSESLEAIAKLVEEYLPEVKKASKDVKVNRLVCGGCLDFKLMTTVPLDDFGPWEASGFAPEAEFLEKLKAIDGVSQVETQTITNMEI